MKLPDILEITPLAKPPNCSITVPGSKSITNRALILAALSDKKCTLCGALWADDTQVMVDSLQRLGFEVEVQPDPVEECNRTIVVEGRGGTIPNPQAELYVGNAGTAARFLAAFVTLGFGEYTIRGDKRMHERPMADLLDALRQLGVEVIATKDRLPAVLRSRGISSGRVRISASQSSQFASALLLIARHAKLDVHVELDEPHGYIEMTRKLIENFKPDYLIEPDLSSASYFAAADWLSGGKIAVAGWPKKSLQIDGEFPKYLPPPRFVSRLKDLGDSVMTLAICALFGDDPMTLEHAERMRVQESDRIHAMVAQLSKVGAHVEGTKDGFTVWPARLGELHGADIETYNDHRMAMCFSVLGLKVPGIRIKNPSCVNKTFPNFFDKLEQLRR